MFTGTSSTKTLATTVGLETAGLVRVLLAAVVVDEGGSGVSMPCRSVSEVKSGGGLKSIGGGGGLVNDTVLRCWLPRRRSTGECDPALDASVDDGCGMLPSTRLSRLGRGGRVASWLWPTVTSSTRTSSPSLDVMLGGALTARRGVVGWVVECGLVQSRKVCGRRHAPWSPHAGCVDVGSRERLRRKKMDK